MTSGPKEPDTNALHNDKMKALKAEQDAKVRAKKERRGIVIVNTGDGKGKSTAAFGLAMRSAGHGLPVALFQFIKGNWKTGEIAALRRFDEVETVTCGNGFTWNTQDRQKDMDSAREGWEAARAKIESCRCEEPPYHVVVLDELNVVLHYGFLPTEEVAEVLRDKPKELTIVITGRDAPQAIMDVADTVTEMKPIKHAFDSGIQARKGVEF